MMFLKVFVSRPKSLKQDKHNYYSIAGQRPKCLIFCGFFFRILLLHGISKLADRRPFLNNLCFAQDRWAYFCMNFSLKFSFQFKISSLNFQKLFNVVCKDFCIATNFCCCENIFDTSKNVCFFRRFYYFIFNQFHKILALVCF